MVLEGSDSDNRGQNLKEISPGTESTY